MCLRSARYFLRIPEYFKFLDTERTGRLTYAKIKDALMTLSRAPPLNIMAHKLIAEKRVGTVPPEVALSEEKFNRAFVFQLPTYR